MTTSMDKRSGNSGCRGGGAHRHFCAVCIHYSVLYYYFCMDYEDDEEDRGLLMLIIVLLCMRLDRDEVLYVGSWGDPRVLVAVVAYLDYSKRIELSIFENCLFAESMTDFVSTILHGNAPSTPAISSFPCKDPKSTPNPDGNDHSPKRSRITLFPVAQNIIFRISIV